MVNIDYLQFRKNKVRQPMQYAWCAATTKSFLGPNANKISRKEIIDLDIGSLCDDIMTGISDLQEGKRCTLYLSSMLTSGAVKLFQAQTTVLMEDCEKLIMDLLGGQELTSQKKKKKTKGQQIPQEPPEEYISLTPLSTPKFDIVKELSKKNVEDHHLMSEIDFIDMPEHNASFGFNPNEQELTDGDLAALYKEIMGEGPQPLVTEDRPQDNEVLEMNDEPMRQEPALDLNENQSPPDRDEIMKTPKRPTRSGKSKQKPPNSSESAKTAYSPPKKRSRTATYMPNDDGNENMMVATEPTREASLPGEVPLEAGLGESPIFNFRKRSGRRNISLKNLEHVKDKAKDVAAIFDVPMMEAPMQQELPPPVDPIDGAQVNLPEVSFHEPPPPTTQPEDNVPTQSQNAPLHASPTAAAEPDANGSAHVPTQSQKVSASDLSLGTLRSFEENSRKKYIKRGKKIFADRTKQVEIEAREPKFMTKTRYEVLFPGALSKQSVDLLLNYPATLKRDYFLPEYRHWSGKLLDNYYQAIEALTLAVPQKAPSQKRKKREEESRENSQENKRPPIENMEIVQEQPQHSSPPNDQPGIEVPEPRPDSILENNPVNMETVEPPADVAPAVDVQTDKPENQITSDVTHGAAHEVEQPPIEEPVIQEPPLPEVTDQVETVMPPKKRFKQRDDSELLNMDALSRKNLTVDELFELIKSFWNKLTKRDIDRLGFISVEFERVIRPGYFSVVEVGRHLRHCFLLENKKKLYLQQNIPYDTIYLIKINNHS